MMGPYSITSNIPEPIIFNCWKHHFSFILKQIRKARHDKDQELLQSGLVKIGTSQIDFYIGELEPEDITRQVLQKLNKTNLINTDSYLQWIHENPDLYQKIQISDGSWWTMKEGNLYGRYIHIHPGRYSPNTIRVKAPVLKTVITMMFLAPKISELRPNVKIINKARTEMLKLPPIKAVIKDSDFLNVFNLFAQALSD